MSNKNIDLFQKIKKSRVFSNILISFRLDNKKVLDVGCSEGHYLQCFGCGSVGVTIIPEHVSVAKEKGMKVLLKNVEDSDFSLEDKFDVIWANNLFEHMNAPHLFLMKMREVLDEDGVMILGVPVIPFFSFLTHFKKFRGAYAVSHVNFFNRHTLMKTVEAAGWEVKEARLFFLKNSFLDSILNFVAPHIYIVASPKAEFSYPKKRLLSLEGYDK